MKLPVVLAFTLLGGGAVIGLAPGCDHGGGTHDAAIGDAHAQDAQCLETCIHDNATEDPCGCVDQSFACPTGCRACSLFCIAAASDGGTPQCPACAAADGTCPSGCQPIG